MFYTLFHVQYCTANGSEVTQYNTIFGNRNTEQMHLMRRMHHWKPRIIRA
jgi:hypothetical protein